jgi:hypothetical protein
MNKVSRRGVNEWRKIVSAQPTSGSSIAAYCRDRGISQPSFFAWRRRFGTLDGLPSGLSLRVEDGAGRLNAGRLAEGAGPAFVEVTAAEAIKASQVHSHEAIEICLQGGRRLLVRRGFDHDLLIELVRVLEDVA